VKSSRSVSWSSPKSAIARVLAGTLAWSLSGAPTLLVQLTHPTPHAWAQDLSSAHLEELEQLGQRIETLDTSLRRLLRRARHPSAPGTTGGAPQTSELTAAERELESLATQIERLLALPATSTSPSQRTFPSDAKLRLINLHFNLVTALINVEIALRRDHSAAFLDRFVLEVPSAQAQELPGLGSIAQGRLGERYHSLVMDRGPDGRATTTRLKLSANLIHGMELGQLADDPNSQNYLTLVKYLTVQQLVQNLASLKSVKANRSLDPISIPRELTSQLPTLGITGDLLAEQERAIAEPGARAALAHSFSSIRDSLPAFADSEFVAAFAREAGSSDAMRRDLQAPLSELFAESWRTDFEELLSQELENAPTLFSVLDESSQTDALRSHVSSAAANVVLQKTISLVTDGILVIPMEKRAGILAKIDERKSTWAASLSTSTLQSWARNARSVSQSTLYESKRNQLISSLQGQAFDLEVTLRELRRGNRISLRPLVHAVSSDIAALNPTGTALGWFQTITRETSWNAARDKYAEILSSQTSPDILVNGLVQPALLERWIEQNISTSSPRIGFSDPAMERHLGTRVVDARAKNLRDIRQIAELMGFHRILSGNEPTLAELLRGEEKLQSYRSALRESLLDQYPILAMTVQSPARSDEQISLAQALREASPNLESTEESWTAATRAIDEAIRKTETRIRSTITRVSRATSLREIETAATSAVNLELMLSVFPTQSAERERALEQLATHSLTDRFIHGNVGSYLSYGFGALLLLHATGWVVRPARPFVQAINWGLEPLIKGYMASAIPLVMLDTAYYYQDLNRQESSFTLGDDLFAGSPLGGALIDHANVSALRSSYAWARGMFWGRVILDVATMYAPEALHLVNRLNQRMALRDFMGDIDAFHTLGVPLGNWGAVTRAQVQAQTREVLFVPSAVNEIESAYARLQSRIQSGKTWNPDRVFQGEVRLETLRGRNAAGEEITEQVPVRVTEPSNPIERRIYRALRARFLGGTR
jgi:hypothetical protein